MTARVVEGSASSSDRTASTTLAARYRSLFVIGRGGMGSVEAALTIEAGDRASSNGVAESGRVYERIVALKRLLPDAARDKRRVDMFLREARLAAMLDHPNVVSAYDYGELDGELYLAMEYVEGQPLSRVLHALEESGKRMPPALVAYVLAEVCRGLHAAHELADPATGVPLQLVHRDVSPQNVMLGYDGRVRLLDFGVAKIETENVTKTGEVKGKTAYMSPEQAMGDALDRRSDLFGVGAILFECLALRRMWGDGTDMDVIRRLALESPPALETCGVEVPKEMTELYTRLVAREPKGRPATALEVADALGSLVADATASALELRELLDTHFAGVAKEQRTRLTASLIEVAPAQADELRESMLPANALTPVRARSVTARTDSGVVATAAAAAPSSSRTSVLLAVAGVAIVATLVWRLTAGEAPPLPATATPTTATSALTTATTSPIATATVTATAAAAAASTATTPAPSAAPSSRPPPVLPRPTASARVVAVPSVATSRPVAPPPTASTKPADVDDHPF